MEERRERAASRQEPEDGWGGASATKNATGRGDELHRGFEGRTGNRGEAGQRPGVLEGHRSHAMVRIPARQETHAPAAEVTVAVVEEGPAGVCLRAFPDVRGKHRHRQIPGIVVRHSGQQPSAPMRWRRT